MSWLSVLQSIITAISLAVIIAIGKLFWDVVELKRDVRPVLTWYEKTSMDALKIATNPTSERLTRLAEKYAAFVIGKGQISAQEKQELVDGLRQVMNNTNDAGKRSSASMSLRFIETREGITAHRKAASNSNH